MKNKILIALATAFALSGCVSQQYTDNAQESLSVQGEIQTKIAKSVNYDKAVKIELPPFDSNTLIENQEPKWLKNRIGWSAAGVSLSDVLSMVLDSNPESKHVEVIYGEGVQPNKIVGFNLANGTIKEALNRLTAETDYGFIYSNNKISVERYLSETFTVKLPPGEYSAQMGNQGKRAGDDESAIVEGQFVNAILKDQNIVDKARKAIEGIITKKALNSEGREVDIVDGSVTAIDGLSMINVTATPAKMKKVKRYMADLNAELSKQALFDYQVLEFRSVKGNERGVDLNLVKDIGEGTLQFFTQGTTLYSSSTGYGFSFEGANGWDGTTAFIKALEKQGSVSFKRPITQLALNNQPVRSTQNLDNPYLDNISTTVNEGVTTTDFERGNVTEGIDIATVAKVDDEFAWIRVTGNIRSVVDVEDRELGNNQVRFYTTRKSDINFTGKVRYGRTYIITRVSETKIRNDKTKNFGTEYIGSNATEKELVETIILLTPRRFEQ